MCLHDMICRVIIMRVESQCASMIQLYIMRVESQCASMI